MIVLLKVSVYTSPSQECIFSYHLSLLPKHDTHAKEADSESNLSLKHQIEDLKTPAFLCGIDILVALKDQVVAENRGQPLLGDNGLQVVVTRGADVDGDVAVDVNMGLLVWGIGEKSVMVLLVLILLIFTAMGVGAVIVVGLLLDVGLSDGVGGGRHFGSLGMLCIDAVTV